MRQETTTRTLYLFDELPTEEAKEKARDWYREGMFDHDWWDFQYEDAKNIGLEITSFDVDRNEIEGKLQLSINEVCKKIKSDHGKSCGTYKLAKTIDLRKQNDDADLVYDFKKALLKEYLSALRAEVEYMESDESVDESIRINEYEFTENGKRA